MNYRIKMTAEQVRAVAEWAARGFADVLLDDADDDRIVAGQGDERVTFNTDGVECCERCGALDGEELQGGACYSCGLGHEDDPEAMAPGRCEHGALIGFCTAGCGSRPTEPTGDRIAREGRQHLEAARDIDYDPAAEDDDGVPLFSNETAGRPTDDPRYQRGAH